MRAVVNEIVGLFVDDGLLALGLLGWCAAVGVGERLMPALAWGPILLVGCSFILLGSVLRAARVSESGHRPPR